ncbi:DUF2218 domain-containing protein [Limimaricola cinnabarinus]|uniref:DUF2218 domain-containing protein n=1 Tax=Limimaricola cinnabarinus TaxID=1125964 RepID=A0A2G1MCI2_9RHOB|nr:hypothetical protein CJ301_16695 [Limimaricola cinnabarinus]
MQQRQARGAWLTRKSRFRSRPACPSATDEELIVRISVETAEARDRARAVIDDHLARFAHREGFERMAWQGPASLSRD